MPKWLDLPPMWLALFAALAWCQAAWVSLGLGFGGSWARHAGGALLVAGLILIALAALEFTRHRTTIIPHRQPSGLITTGIFRLTRNPIYLADLLILTGLILRWDAVLSLVLVPVLHRILQNRFIVAEEDRMKQAFGATFDAYAARVRRWI